MAVKVKRYVADFETTTDPSDVRVWASGLCEIETGEVCFIGNDIESFFNYLKNKNSVVYFHNLKFDGEFILSYLLRNGYKWNDSREAKTFNTLITDSGIFYSITVFFEKKNKQYKKVVFYDSYKKLPFKVSVIAKAFNLEMSKLSIDYDAPRPKGHILTDEEREYLIADLKIVAEALKIQFNQGLKKMTNASDALTGYKKLNEGRFEKWFPVLPVELDTDIRQAYKGGFTFLAHRFKNKTVSEGVTLDVNSLYPWVMYTKLLPYGYPVFFEGEPVPDEKYPLFIIHMKCGFKLKKKHIPTIQLKNSFRFIPTDYIEDSITDDVELHLTSVDYQLFLDHYEIYNPEYINGWKFKGTTGMFTEYIDYWMHIKETNTGALRQLAKLMLNSLYGKFATNPKSRQKEPILDSDGIVRYTVTKPELRDPVYTVMGCFITAYAREKTIRSAQSVYDRFIYADTDSLHLTGSELPDMEIHPTRLGAWKHEGTFTKGKYIRAKTYLETIDGVDHVTCAGMPDNIKEMVTYDNFHPGSTFDGKLMPKRFPGGVVLMPTTFTIN